MTERQIGNYKILKQIGSGGMAKVYLAVHENVPNLKVVLKILSNPQHAARFIQEADKLAQLDKDPNICHIKGLFYHEDELVIAMEYIDGKSLEDLIVEKGRFSAKETIAIITDLLAALAAAHDKAIYHRDIKPSNIMFEKDGRLKIIDFGIAKGKTDPQMTIEGTATGTPEYMAPEQFEGGEHLDYAKCDIYAVGTMMYRMLTGQLPFQGENQFILRDKKRFEDITPPSRLNPEIPGELDRIILKSIERDPAARFASIAEMRSELLRIAGSAATPTEAPAIETAPAPGSKPARGRKRARTLGMVAIGVIIAAAAVYAVVFMRGGGDRNIPEPKPADIGVILKTHPADTDTVSVETVPPSAVAVDTPRVKTRHVAIRPPLGPGFLRVSGVRDAYVYIDDEMQPETTPFTYNVSPGTHAVTIRAVVNGKGVAFSDTVTIRSGQTKSISHKFEE
jgi:predicted Ser/Thr protein kinase